MIIMENDVSSVSEHEKFEEAMRSIRKVKLITGERIPRTDFQELSKERRNLLKNRDITPTHLALGRKAVFQKYNSDTFEPNESFNELDEITKQSVNHALNGCDVEFAIKQIQKAKFGEVILEETSEEKKRSRRRKLFLVGLILCAGDNLEKKKRETEITKELLGV